MAGLRSQRQTLVGEPPVYEQPPPPYESLDELLPSDSNSHTTRSAPDSASFYDNELFELPPSPGSINSNPDELPPAYISRRTLFRPPGFVPSNSPPPAPRPYIPSCSSPLHTPRGFVPSSSSRPQVSSWSHETLSDKEKALKHPKGFKPTRTSASSSTTSSYRPHNASTTSPLLVANNNLSRPRGFKPSSGPLNERTVGDVALDHHRRMLHSHGNAGVIAGSIGGNAAMGF